jgi:integrase
MARRPKNTPPSYRKHRQSGQAIVSLPRGDGTYKDVLLGAYGSAPSRAEYARVVAEFEASGGQVLPRGPCPVDLTIAELILRFWPHVEAHYRDPDGKPTSEVTDFRYSLKPLRELYGLTLALKAVRQRMVDAGLARITTNHRVGRIVRMFKWAVSEELIPETVYRALATVRGLQKGRTSARETEPVQPVADAHVDATLAFLSPTLRAMVELQRLTGMRPGEVVRVRAYDLETGAGVWFYRPGRHKTAYRGKPRVVAIGPRAQAILKPFLQLDTQAYLFSPARVMEDFRRGQRAARRTKVQPSQADRKKPEPEKRPGERYTREAYSRAIAKACDAAFPPPGDLARVKVQAKRGRRWETLTEWQARLGAEKWAEMLVWRDAHRWHPHQLRHSHATMVRRRFGLEAAQVALGHAQANITELYAERDLKLAEKVAAEIG